MSISGDDALDPYYPAATVTIDVADGRRYVHHTRYPLGHRLNPLGDSQLADKFLDLAGPWIGESKASQIMALIWNLDALDDVRQLTDLLREPVRERAMHGS